MIFIRKYFLKLKSFAEMCCVRLRFHKKRSHKPKIETLLAWGLAWNTSNSILSKIFKQGQFIYSYLAPLKLLLWKVLLTLGGQVRWELFFFFFFFSPVLYVHLHPYYVDIWHKLKQSKKTEEKSWCGYNKSYIMSQELSR